MPEGKIDRLYRLLEDASQRVLERLARELQEGDEHSMKTWTRDDVMAERPCVSREVVAGYFAGRERVSLLEVVLDGRIPTADVLWLALLPGALTRRQRERWIGWIVDLAVERYALKCGTPAVEVWAARWLSGEDRTTAAAWEAAGAAWTAWGAARAAARAAAGAAWTAWGAARAAARAAAREEQRAYLLGIL